ncbi:MAG: polymer-forming cytoskeletal protein [Candidatus Omnitrophica bacterium]|nr:polymer-forming cytoskeletal protein [Candidatus Omnitrophota bacterium]
MLGRERRGSAAAGPTVEERVLEVTAAMQGTLSFKDPVNLRISGRFDGALETLGTLTIGERAQVSAQITGETIVIAGRVSGKIVAKRQLTLVPPAKVTADLWTPRLAVQDGAMLEGACHMSAATEAAPASPVLSVEEVAQYLELEPAAVRQWAAQGRIPATRDGAGWRFDKSRLDEWIASERARARE